MNHEFKFKKNLISTLFAQHQAQEQICSHKAKHVKSNIQDQIENLSVK